MQLDLNLLTALDALLEEGSVMGAAQRLHLSTPATSRTLGRIRSMTGDQILVRTGRTMTPTPYALAVREQVHQIVLQARAVLRPHRDLDLANLERTFTLRCHDTLTSAIAATLVSEVQANAPSVTLRFLSETATDTSDLRHGRVDLEIGATQPDLPEVRSEMVGEAHLALALGPDHRLLDDELTVDGYASAQHVIVSRRGRLRDPIDDALARRGLSRRVVAAAPTSTIALQIVAATDTVTSIIENGCRPTLDALGLRTLPLPLPPVPVICAWHQRYDTDPAHQWLLHQTRRAITRALWT